MKITFIIPTIELYGGIIVVFEYANFLQSRGHDVSVVYPLIPVSRKTKWYDLKEHADKALKMYRNLKMKNKIWYFNLNAQLMRVPTLDRKYIPDSDVVIATWWPTAFYVDKYDNKKGEKFYFFQDVPDMHGPTLMLRKTCNLGLHIITISSYLKDIIEKSFDAKVDAVILNGINLKKYYPEHVDRTDDKIRILMPYRHERWKGVDDGINAFKIVEHECKNVRLIMYGSTKPKGIECDNIEFHFKPTNDELRWLYNKCDVFLFPSTLEGFGLPPMEAMACKSAVVTTNVGGVPDFAIDGKTAFVIEPGNIEKMAQRIIELVNDQGKRDKIAENGYNYIKQFTWDKATDEMEKIITNHRM